MVNNAPKGEYCFDKHGACDYLFLYRGITPVKLVLKCDYYDSPTQGLPPKKCKMCLLANDALDDETKEGVLTFVRLQMFSYGSDALFPS